MLFATLMGAPAVAHHSIGMIEIGSPVWVEATVVRYEPRNPHVLIHVEQRLADGRVTPLTVEGPIMARLERMNLPRDFLKPGDVIRLCGFPFRKDIVANHASAPAGTPELPALHAHLIIRADGQWQPWGPYGKLDNCIREDDGVDAWVAFIGRDAMAREYWCKAQGYPAAQRPEVKSKSEEITRRMAPPACDARAR